MKFRNIIHLTLILCWALLFSFKARAEDSCRGSSTTNPLGDLKITACELEKQTLQCDEYFKKYQIPKEKMRTCRSEEKFVDVASMKACASGAGGFFKSLYEKTKNQFMIEMEKLSADSRRKADFESACEADQSLAIKRSLEKRSYLEGVSKKHKSDEELKSISCRELMSAVEARDNFREFQKYASSLESQDFKDQWDEARHEAFSDLKSQIQTAAEKADIALKCFSPSEQVEISCRIASALVSGVAVNRLMAIKGSAAAAEIAQVSEADYLAQKIKKLSSWKALGAAEARRIIAAAGKTAAGQVRAAVGYVKSKKYPSVAAKVGDLETLLRDIRKSNNDWHYKKVYGDDGSTVFVGNAGHAVVIDSQGKIYKGLLDYTLFERRGVWSANYSNLDLIPE